MKYNFLMLHYMLMILFDANIVITAITTYN